MRSLDIIVLRSLGLDRIENSDTLCLLGFFLGNVTHLHHRVEDLMLASDQLIMTILIIGVKDSGIIRNSSEERGLGESQILCGFIKVSLSSGLNTITAATVRRLIKIHRNDSLLIIHLL